MEPLVGQHRGMLVAAPPHSSQLEDVLIPSPNITPQQEQWNNGSSSNKVAGNKSQPEQSLKCPRCDSTNTKFCYYNNYSLSQPRYFCKSCRRYWTKGGTLRNVPVGGGCRKNKRPSSSSSSSSSRRTSAHIDPQFSAVSTEANSIPFIVNGFHMDLGMSEFVGGPPQKRFNVLDHDLSFLGSLGLGVGAAPSSANIPGLSEYSMIRNGLFQETQHHHGSFENFYQGLNSGATPTGGAVPKQEMESGLENENRVLWGFPWNGGSESAEVDSGRSVGSWNGVINTATTNWNGLVNGPLMM